MTPSLRVGFLGAGLIAEYHSKSIRRAELPFEVRRAGVFDPDPSRAERFAALVKDRVIRSPYVPGVRAFIERHAMTHQQYICTGTPESEMRDITDARGISRFFTGIYGSPATKVTILTRIIQEASVDASTCVFFGDALTDHEAAVAIGVPFVGVASHHTEFPVETVVIRDFHDPMLAQVLQR